MAWNNRYWERWIRQLSQNSACVKWSFHAKQQMLKRGITMPVALDVLRHGSVHRAPEINIRTGSTECRMERFSVGLRIGVVVALDRERAPSCLVVTAFFIGE